MHHPRGSAPGISRQPQHDVQDHLTRVIDGEGTVTGYHYSDRDLLTREISEVSGVTGTTYTDSGEQESKTDARGLVETRAYDELDRLTSIDYPDDSLDIAYAYDNPAVDFSIGRLTGIERDGHAISYSPGDADCALVDCRGLVGWLRAVWRGLFRCGRNRRVSAVSWPVVGRELGREL